MARGWVPDGNPSAVNNRQSRSPGVPGICSELLVRLDNGDTYSARVLARVRGRTQLGNFRDGARRSVLPCVKAGALVTVVWGASNSVYGRAATICAYNPSARHIEVEYGDLVEVPDRRQSHRIPLRRSLTLFVLSHDAGEPAVPFGPATWTRGISVDASVDTIRVWSGEALTEGLSVFVSLRGRKERWERTAEVVRSDVPQGMLGWRWKRLAVLRWVPGGEAVQREWLLWVSREMLPGVDLDLSGKQT